MNYTQVHKVAVCNFDGVVLSPGPGVPEEYQETWHFLEQYIGKKPILGVCLGLQMLVQYCGGNLQNLPSVLHGKQVEIRILDKDCILFQQLQQPVKVGLYHSWCADATTLSNDFRVTAQTEMGIIMAIAHKTHAIQAVQFHPESYMTVEGAKMLLNWVKSLSK